MDLPKKNSGLGGGNSGGSIAADPKSFDRSTPPEEMSANWQKISLDITSGLADAWLELKPSEDLVAVASALGSEQDTSALPEALSLRVQFEDYGHEVTFQESKLATLALEYLETKLSVSYRHGLTQISSNLFVNANDLSGESGFNITERGDSDSTWFAPWVTSFGSRCFVNMKAFTTDDAEETIVFYTQGIVGTRAAERLESGELSEAESDFRQRILPNLAKKLLYVSETPFPSSIAALSRQIAYSEVPPEFWPKPFFNLEDFNLVICPFEDDWGNAQANAHIYPQVIHFGWSLQSLHTESIDAVISSVVDSIVRLTSVLEDGFRNYSGSEAPAGWGNYFVDFDSICEAGSRALTSRWIPITQIGALTEKSKQIYQRSSKSSQREEDLRWVSEYGAGEAVSHAVNTLAYSYLIPDGNYEEAVDYLTAAVELDHRDQSTNALSNLALVYVAAGQSDVAENYALRALERHDKYSEGEASLTLAKIYLARKNENAATEMFTRAAKSGQEPYATEARKGLSSQGAESDTDTAPQGVETRFCGSCGVEFANPDQRFCGQCGSKRG